MHADCVHRSFGTSLAHRRLSRMKGWGGWEQAPDSRKCFHDAGSEEDLHFVQG